LASWATKLVATVAVVGVVATVVATTVVTCGATSIAGTMAITSAITVAAKSIEVATNQKSKSEGKDGGQIAIDVVESVFDNGIGIVTKTAATKTASYSVGFLSQSSTFQDVLKLQKLDGYSASAFLGASKYELTNRFINFKECVSGPFSTKGMIMSYAFAAFNVGCAVDSYFTDDPEQRAIKRGYKLK
jgi:hypothetical protein